MSNNNQFFNNATNSFTSEGIASKEELIIEPEFPSTNSNYNQTYNHGSGAYNSYGYNTVENLTSYPGSSCSTFVNSNINTSSNYNMQINTSVINSERLKSESSIDSNSSSSNINNSDVAPFEIGEYLGLSLSEQKSTTKKKKTKERQAGVNVDKLSKQARDSGVTGVGRSGEVIKAREMKEGCEVKKCRFKCANKITGEERRKIFDDFWSLGDHAKQWKRITELTYTKPMPGKKRKIIDSDSEFEDDNEKKKKRKEAFTRHKYILPTSNGPLVVCKTMFCNTLNISQAWIRTALAKLCHNGGDMSDMRGKHKNRPMRVAADLKDSARRHIERFPTFESWHYTGQTEQKYLEEGLTISKMYELYEEKQNSLEQKMVNKHMFRDMVNDEYKYKVFINPGKEKCGECEKYNNLEPEEKTRQVEEKQCIHAHNKNVLKDLAKSDKQRASEDPSFCAANFDLSRLVALPKTNVPELIYHSKLCTWNLTIFELASFAGHCNLWTEVTGSRQPKEIASFILHFLYNKYVAGTREFSLYSKICKELNRNKLFISMLVKVANDLNIKVTHRFFEKGHTNYGCQSIQAKIEHYCGRKNIYTPQEFAKMIWESKSDNRYIVEERRQEDIYDFEELSDKFNLKMIDMGDLKEVVIEPNKMTIGIKYVIDQTPTQIKIFKNNVTIKEIKDYKLKCAYNGKIPLSERKKKDFMAMIEKNLIPNEFKHYYSSLVL